MNLFSPDVQYYWTYWTITGHLLDILDITGHTGQYWTLLDNTGRGKPGPFHTVDNHPTDFSKYFISLIKQTHIFNT